MSVHPTLSPHNANAPVYSIKNQASNGRIATVQMPSHQGKVTGGHPTVTEVNLSSYIVLDQVFGTGNEQLFKLAPRQVLRGSGLIKRLGLFFDLKINTAPIQLVALWYWFKKIIITQDTGQQKDMITITPEQCETWFQTYIREDNLQAYANEMNVKIAGTKETSRYLDLTDPVYPTPTTQRFTFWFDMTPLNDLHINNNKMISTLIFKWTSNSDDIISNDNINGTVGSYTCVKTGFLIESIKLTAEDQVALDSRSAMGIIKQANYMDPLQINPSPNPITISNNGGQAGAFNINSINDGGMIALYNIYGRVVTDQFSPYNSGCNVDNQMMTSQVCWGDYGTLDFLDGNTSIINDGQPQTFKFYQETWLAKRGNIRNSLLVQDPTSVILPLTNSISAAEAGAPMGSWPQRGTDTFTIRIFPTVQVMGEHVLTKLNGANAYSGGTIAWYDPLTGDTTPYLPYNATQEQHETAIENLPRLARAQMVVSMSTVLNNASATVTFTFLNSQLNDLGKPLGYYGSGLICNGLIEIPTIVITELGQRGVALESTIQMSIEAWRLCIISVNGGTLHQQIVRNMKCMPANEQAKEALGHNGRGMVMRRGSRGRSY